MIFEIWAVISMPKPKLTEEMVEQAIALKAEGFSGGVGIDALARDRISADGRAPGLRTEARVQLLYQSFFQVI